VQNNLVNVTDYYNVTVGSKCYATSFGMKGEVSKIACVQLPDASYSTTVDLSSKLEIVR
jgi:hypothetical protein